MSRAPLREALLTHEIALHTGAVRLPHRDPADRFLVATAVHLDLTLVPHEPIMRADEVIR